MIIMYFFSFFIFFFSHKIVDRIMIEIVTWLHLGHSRRNNFIDPMASVVCHMKRERQHIILRS